MRDLLQEVFEIRRQANADTVAPYIGALSAIRLGLTAPDVVEEEIPDAEGIAEGFDRYRDALAETGSGGLRRADLPGHRDPPDRSRRPTVGPGPVPPPAGRRVPGPHPRPPAADPPAGRSRVRLLRGGRRRPGDLRLLGGHPRVPHRLPPVLPRRRPPSAGGELPLPAVGGGRGQLAALLQRPSDREDDPVARGPRRRRRATCAGPLAGAGPVAVRAVPGDELAALATEIIADWQGCGVEPTRHRRPGPGQLGTAAGAGGLHGARHPVRHSAGGRRAGPDRHADRLRLPPDRCRSRPHPDGRTSATPSGRPSRGIAPWWWTWSPSGRARRSPTSGAWPVDCRAGTSPS